MKPLVQARGRSIGRVEVATRWRLAAAPDPEAVRALERSLDLHPLVAQLLVARGYRSLEDAETFLKPDLGDLHDPMLFVDMDRAVARLMRALAGGERITVYGDYDVDGVTSTAILISFLRQIGAQVEAYIPHRLKEGYGLNLNAVREIAARGTRLLLTCDCGVTAVEEVDAAARAGMDVVVIDHHRVPTRPPAAVAILNPYREDCRFPFRHLAAVGVTFNLLMALRRALREAGWFHRHRQPEPNLGELLDLVALGTVADVVPLVGENRIFVAHGLRRLAEAKRPGIVALKEVAGIEPGPVSAGQIAFRLGPRINAAGRLDEASVGLSLLLSGDLATARRLAADLDAANEERRRIEREITAEAAAQAEAKLERGPGLVLVGDGWHRGIVGIVASRMVERFHRPTLVLARDGDRIRGSGRSIPAFDLHAGLGACARHLERFGGHRAAAGLELQAAHLEAFEADFLDACVRALAPEDLLPELAVDAELCPTEVDLRLACDLERLAPFGLGNRAPVFLARGVRIRDARLVGRGEPAHLKGRVDRLEAIGFGLGDAIGFCGAGRVDLAYGVEFNRFRGRTTLQARLRAVVPAGRALVSQQDGAETAEMRWGHPHF